MQVLKSRPSFVQVLKLSVPDFAFYSDRKGAELRFRLRFFLFLVLSRPDAHASRCARNRDELG